MTSAERMNPYRTTARIIGALFIAGMVIGIGGNIQILSILGPADPLASVAASSMLIGVGVLCWMFTVVGDVAHGILVFPLLKRHSERMAIGYLAFRIVDGVFIAVMALFILLQLPLANEYVKAGSTDATFLQGVSAVFAQVHLYAYHIAMLTLGIAGSLLCYTFYRTRLVPRPIAVWGLVGYAVILAGSAVEVLGFDLRSMHAIPGGLWELFIGVWLIAKGFNVMTIDSGPVATEMDPRRPGLSAA